jgi:DNA-binding NarL/FixJ family response regulator
MNGAIRVVLADDQPLVLEGIKRVLDGAGDIDVVAAVTDGRQAIDAALRTRPDVAVIDIHMPILDGLAAAEQILALDSTVRVLVLTTFDPDEYVYRALRAGASGFLLKDTPLDELILAVRLVAKGGSLLAPSVTRRVIEEYANRPSTPPSPDEALPALTSRERDVLAQITRGLNNAEIGRALHLSEATVKTHIRSMLLKLGLRDRTQLVIAAYESGFVQRSH